MSSRSSQPLSGSILSLWSSIPSRQRPCPPWTTMAASPSSCSRLCSLHLACILTRTQPPPLCFASPRPPSPLHRRASPWPETSFFSRLTLWTPPAALRTHAHLLSLFRTPVVASQPPPSPQLPSPAPSLQPSSSLSKQRSSTLGYLLEGRALSYQQKPWQRSGSLHDASIR